MGSDTLPTPPYIDAAAGPVEMEANLRCASRYHSLWMAQTNSFSHESPGGDLGEDPWERIDSTAFDGFAVGENIAAGYDGARGVVARGGFEGGGAAAAGRARREIQPSYSRGACAT